MVILLLKGWLLVVLGWLRFTANVNQFYRFWAGLYGLSGYFYEAITKELGIGVGVIGGRTQCW
jgi:hypothetical protein